MTRKGRPDPKTQTASQRIEKDEPEDKEAARGVCRSVRERRGLRARGVKCRPETKQPQHRAEFPQSNLHLKCRVPVGDPTSGRVLRCLTLLLLSTAQRGLPPPYPPHKSTVDGARGDGVEVIDDVAPILCFRRQIHRRGCVEGNMRCILTLGGGSYVGGEQIVVEREVLVVRLRDRRKRDRQGQLL